MSGPQLRKAPAWDEQRIVRTISHLMFFACSCGLVFVLVSWSTPWLGFAAGALVFGLSSAWLAARAAEEATIRVERAEAAPHRFQVLPPEGER